MDEGRDLESLRNADLIVDKLYLGGKSANAGTGNDPISRLLQCGNQGGFRYRGSLAGYKIPYIVLISSLSEPDWPDFIDLHTGVFIYYGDNRSPGSLLHDTQRKGNLVLRWLFDLLHGNQTDQVPPIFVFTKSGSSRDYVFRGLAVPGASGLSQTEDLVAVWKSKEGQRFQNYRATFTLLDIARVPRSWIADIQQGNPFSENCPRVWREWTASRRYRPLTAEPTLNWKTKEQQLPVNQEDKRMVQSIYEYFAEKPTSFEKCAAELFRLMDKNVVKIDVTRPSRDGGRDAIGEYRIGYEGNNIKIKFALEAKLYALNNPVTVKETSRLISRLRHREFGVFVTTSYMAAQAYQELIEDRHPIVIISATNIVDILRRNGLKTLEQVQNWLRSLSAS